jgi:hypothetical protein
MAEERRNVNHQQGKTPGRRGEEIKQEEIDKKLSDVIDYNSRRRIRTRQNLNRLGMDIIYAVI